MITFLGNCKSRRLDQIEAGAGWGSSHAGRQIGFSGP